MQPPPPPRGYLNPNAAPFIPSYSQIQEYNQPNLANTGFLIKIIYGFLIMSMRRWPNPCKPPPTTLLNHNLFFFHSTPPLWYPVRYMFKKIWPVTLTVVWFTRLRTEAYRFNCRGSAAKTNKLWCRKIGVIKI